MMILKPLKLICRSEEQFDDGTYKWKATCGCGKDFLVRKRNVEIGQTKSCGCYRRMNSKAMRLLESENRLPNEGTIIPTAYYRYQQAAKTKNREFTLSYSQFETLVKANCHYCDRPADRINGIDRKYNDMGYTEENSITCCSICNYFKSALDYNDFLSQIKLIYINLTKYHDI